MRVLLLSYHVYPNGTAEGLCVAKAARTLADAGHTVEIVTSTVNDLAGTDLVPADGLLVGIPVHRVAAEPGRVPGPLRAWHRFTRAGQRRGGRLRRGWDVLEATTNIVLGCTPDEWAWAQTAGARARALWDVAAQAGTPFDVLYSRLNHFLSHYAALAAVRGRRDLPWCAHFSDPWPGHRYPPGYMHTPTRSGVMERRQERVLAAILRRADSLTFPGERLLRFILPAPAQQARAFAVPHLGNFWQPAPPYQKGDTMRLVFTGFLLTQRRPDALFAALAGLRRRNPEAAAHLRVQFIGRGTTAAAALVAQYDLGGMVETLPPTDFAGATALATGADVLLLIESAMAEGVFMPSKLADYLSARRPILALSPRVGTVADYLAQGGGIRVDADDAAGIEAALADLFARWQTDRLDELIPPQALVDRVAPVCVEPGYRAAFEAAVAHAQGAGR